MNDISIAAKLLSRRKKEGTAHAAMKRLENGRRFPFVAPSLPPEAFSVQFRVSQAHWRWRRPPIQILIRSIWSIVSHFGRGRRRRRSPIKSFYNYYGAANKVERSSGCGPLSRPLSVSPPSTDGRPVNLRGRPRRNPGGDED